MRIVLISAALLLGLLIRPFDVAAQSEPGAGASPAPSADSSNALTDPCTTTLALVSRPSVTTSACSVKSNRLLIETGYQNTTGDGAQPISQFPQTLIRVGTQLPKVEVDVMPPNRLGAGGSSGSGDAAFGAAYELGYTAKMVYGINALATVPTGLNGYSGNGTGYTLNLNANYALTPGTALAGTFGYNSLSDGNQRYTSIIPSLVFSGMVSSSTSVFGEVATFSHALGPVTPTRAQFLVGLQQSLANKLQLDVEAGRSPTQATGKYRYVGVGISYYF